VPGSPFAVGTGPSQIAVDPFGRFIYVVDFSARPIQHLGFGSDIDNNPVGVCVGPDGRFVFEGNANGVLDPGPMPSEPSKSVLGAS